MKTTRSPHLILLAASVCCALAAPHFALAQPEAPVKTKKAAKTTAAKPMGAKKPRAKNLTPRMVTATEAAMGKQLTPELKSLLTASIREREALIQAANDGYYNRFAQATGLTPEQAKEIDKPSRKTAKEPTEPKVEGETNMGELTDTDDAGGGAPVTPK